jgi:DNA-binding transcriptional regulator YiaG
MELLGWLMPFRSDDHPLEQSLGDATATRQPLARVAGPARMSHGYHYTACGLDYVYLVNGYTMHETCQGSGVSIEDARELHERIALDVVGRPHPLRGQEVRFLRGMLRLSQEGLAHVLRQKRGSVARWEAAPRKKIPGAADTALRMFYALKAGGHETATKLIELLQEADELEDHPDSARTMLLRKGHHWTRTAA